MAREDTTTGRDGADSAADPADGPPEKPPGRFGRWFAAQRERRPWLEHLVVAATRYNDRKGDHLAAAITYFSFLALFPLLLLAVSAAGFVLASRPDIVHELGDLIAEEVPGGVGQMMQETIDAAIDSRGVVGGFGLLVLLYSGLGWIGNLRTAVREMWGQPPREPSFLKDKAGDLLALACLGVVLLASVGITAVVGALTEVVLEWTGLDDLPGAGAFTRLLGVAIAILAGMVIFLWVLVNLARRPIAYRAVLRGALLGAVGFELLKYVGTVYIARVAESPAAGVFGSVIGLLVWFNLVSRFVLFTTAWTATSPSVLAAEAKAREHADDAEAGSPDPAGRAAADAGVRGTGGRRDVDTGPRPGPSPRAVFGSLVGLGAVAGMLIPPVVRRWWYAGKPPAPHP